MGGGFVSTIIRRSWSICYDFTFSPMFNELDEVNERVFTVTGKETRTVETEEIIDGRSVKVDTTCEGNRRRLVETSVRIIF